MYHPWLLCRILRRHMRTYGGAVGALNWRPNPQPCLLVRIILHDWRRPLGMLSEVYLLLKLRNWIVLWGNDWASRHTTTVLNIYTSFNLLNCGCSFRYFLISCPSTWSSIETARLLPTKSRSNSSRKDECCYETSLPKTSMHHSERNRTCIRSTSFIS